MKAIGFSILFYFIKATTSSKRCSSKRSTLQVQIAQKRSFGAYKTLLGSTAVILVLLGPSGAYWTIFYGPKCVQHSTVSVAGFSSTFCYSKSSKNPVTPLLLLICKTYLAGILSLFSELHTKITCINFPKT